MNFKEWLISEEIFPNKTATVYHRTCQNCDEDKSVKAVSSILTSDYKTGAGCFYGCGLYTTFAIESQFTDYMKGYGKALVKFKVEELDKYLIFQLSVAKQIHGNDYKMSSQFKKLGLLNKPNVNEGTLRYYDERQEKEKFSSTFAKEFYKQNGWIVNSVKGIIYYGENDGYCLLKYPTVQDGTITMWGYAVADVDNQQKMEELKSNIGWIKSVGVLGTSIKNVYKSPSKMKEKFAFGDNTLINNNTINKLLNSKNLEETAKELVQNIDKLTDSDFSNLISKAYGLSKSDEMAEVIIKYKTKLSDENVRDLMQDLTDKKQEIAELIIKKQPELSNDNVKVLLWRSPYKEKIAELIIKYKNSKLSNDDISLLLQDAIKKDEIAELIIKYKTELTDADVTQLFGYSNNQEKIAEIIIKYKKEFSDDDVTHFLSNARDKDKIAKVIVKYKKELTSNDVDILLDSVTDKEKDKIVELIIENKPELSDRDVYTLLQYAIDKDKIAELLGSKNISKLSYKDISELLDYNKMHTNFGNKIKQIIKKYHMKKTSKIKYLLSKDYSKATMPTGVVIF